MVMKRKSPKKQSERSRGKESEGTTLFDEGRLRKGKKKAKKKAGKRSAPKKQSERSRGKESEGTKLWDMGRMRKR